MQVDYISHRAHLLPRDYHLMLISHAVSLLQRASVPITFIRIFHFSHQLTVSAVWLLRTLGWLEHVLSDHTGLCAKCLEPAKTSDKSFEG